MILGINLNLQSLNSEMVSPKPDKCHNVNSVNIFKWQCRRILGECSNIALYLSIDDDGSNGTEAVSMV